MAPLRMPGRIRYMAGLFPRETEASLRNVLGSYNIKGSMATSDVTALTVVFFVLE